MNRENGDADRGGDIGQHPALVDDADRRQRMHHFLGAALGNIQHHFRHDQHEFLAALAAGDVLAARIGLQHPRKGHQHGIAGLVAVVVVEVLEVVEVEGHHRDLQVSALAARELAPERFGEVAAVEQSG
jgi:hypothetical protein